MWDFWEGLCKFLSHPTVLMVLKLLLAAWIGERFDAMNRDRKARDKTAAEAVEEGIAHPDRPHTAKDVYANSRIGKSVDFNAALDIVSPLFGRSFDRDPVEPKIVKRVSKGRKVLNGLLKVLPLVSRIWLPGV